jgi:hypothetical protein
VPLPGGANERAAAFRFGNTEYRLIDVHRIGGSDAPWCLWRSQVGERPAAFAHGMLRGMRDIRVQPSSPSPVGFLAPMSSPHRVIFTAPALLVANVSISPLLPLRRPQLPAGGPGNIVGSQNTRRQPLGV